MSVIMSDRASGERCPTVYERLCEMFGKKDVDYAIGEAKQRHDSADDPRQRGWLDSAERKGEQITSLGLGDRNRRFAVAKGELSECVPSSKDVNMDAIKTLRRASGDKERTL